MLEGIRFCPRLRSFTSLCPGSRGEGPATSPCTIPARTTPARDLYFTLLLLPVSFTLPYRWQQAVAAAARRLTREVVLQQQNWCSGISRPIDLPSPVSQHFSIHFFFHDPS